MGKQNKIRFANKSKFQRQTYVPWLSNMNKPKDE